MNIQDVPRDYRFWVRVEGQGFVGATAWRCFSCALHSIPVGTSRVLHDRLSHSVQFICKTKGAGGSIVNVDIDQAGWVIKEFGVPKNFAILDAGHPMTTCDHITIDAAPAPIPFGRGASDLPDPAVVIATAERILKEARP